MTTMIYTKRFPIYAGMQFAYPGTIKNKIHKVGYYIVQFKYSTNGQLLEERKVKTVFY